MTQIKAGNNEFFMEESGQVIAKVEFTPSGTASDGKELISIMHTNVYEGNNGRGLGKQLINKVAEYAREENKLIFPVCSYAKKVLESSEEYKDVLSS